MSLQVKDAGTNTVNMKTDGDGSAGSPFVGHHVVDAVASSGAPDIGATTEAAVLGDAAGSLNAKLRALNWILNSVWDSGNGFLNVNQATGLNSVADQVGLGTQSGSGVLPFHLGSLSGTNATLVRSGVGRLHSASLVNNNTGYAVRVKLFDKATAPVPGTDPVKFSFTLPAAVSASQPTVVTFSGPAPGVQFASGVGLALVKNHPDLDATAVASGDVDVNLFYS